MSSLSFGSGITSSFTGSPDRVSPHSGRVTRARIRPVIQDDPLEGRTTVSRFPAAVRLPAFASRPSHSRRELSPPQGRPTGQTAGPRRGYRVPHARVATGLGALSSPRTTVLIPAGARPQSASAAFSTASPCTPPQQPIMRVSASRGINESSSDSPVRSSLACDPRMERERLGFSRASHPADQQPNDPRRGGDRPPSTDLEQHSRHIR